jgi:hypothetical protein
MKHARQQMWKLGAPVVLLWCLLPCQEAMGEASQISEAAILHFLAHPPAIQELAFKFDGKRNEFNGGVNQLMPFQRYGLPSWAFLDAAGLVVAKSEMPNGDDVGVPTQPQEVEWFAKNVRQAAPAISPEELAVLKAELMKR